MSKLNKILECRGFKYFMPIDEGLEDAAQEYAIKVYPIETHTPEFRNLIWNAFVVGAAYGETRAWQEIIDLLDTPFSTIDYPDRQAFVKDKAKQLGIIL